MEAYQPFAANNTTTRMPHSVEPVPKKKKNQSGTGCHKKRVHKKKVTPAKKSINTRKLKEDVTFFNNW